MNGNTLISRTAKVSSHLSFTTLYSIEGHSGVRHVKTDIHDGGLAVVPDTVNEKPAVGHHEHQCLLPKHQLLRLMLAVQHATQDVPSNKTTPTQVSDEIRSSRTAEQGLE